MKLLKLKSPCSDVSAKVDDEDYEALSKHLWWIKRNGRNGTYLRPTTTINGKAKPLHRLLAKASTEEIVDHKNGDTLDNQKHNLRKCSRSQNAQNSRRSTRNASGYKGVRWKAGKWYVEITAFGITYYIGSFSNLFDAAFARKEAEIIYHKEFTYKKF
jgi:hypothetical protein